MENWDLLTNRTSTCHNLAKGNRKQEGSALRKEGTTKSKEQGIECEKMGHGRSDREDDMTTAGTLFVCVSVCVCGGEAKAETSVHAR